MELHGAGVPGLESGQPEVEHDRSLDPLVHHPLTVDLLGDADLSRIEPSDRRVDRVGCLGQQVEVRVCGVDQLSVLRHLITTSIASAHSSTVGTSAMRKCPSPPGPKALPGETTTPSANNRLVEATSSSTFIHR